MKDSDSFIEIPFDEIVKETEKAVLIDFGDKKIWLPKSQVDLRIWSKIIGIKQWVAEIKGLV